MPPLSYQRVYEQINRALLLNNQPTIPQNVAEFVHSLVDVDGDGFVEPNGFEIFETYGLEESCEEVRAKLGLRAYGELRPSSHLLQKGLIPSFGDIDPPLECFESESEPPSCLPEDIIQEGLPPLAGACLLYPPQTEPEAQAALDYYTLLGLVLQGHRGLISDEESEAVFPTCYSVISSTGDDSKAGEDLPIDETEYDGVRVLDMEFVMDRNMATLRVTEESMDAAYDRVWENPESIDDLSDLMVAKFLMRGVSSFPGGANCEVHLASDDGRLWPVIDNNYNFKLRRTVNGEKINTLTDGEMDHLALCLNNYLPGLGDKLPDYFVAQ